MNKLLYFFLLLALLIGCGSPKVVTTTTEAPAVLAAPSQRAATDTIPPGADQQEVTLQGDEGEIAGPFLPPAIPETVYQPYLRRAETTAPSLPYPDNSCHIAVEVRNYDGIDGCGILLESDEGNLFLVGATPRGDPLEAGTRISIGYEFMNNYEGSPCGNADAVIRITCMRLLRVSSGVARPVVCESYDRPSRWLLDLAVGVGATYITRYPWEDGRFVYLIESPSGQYLYDCRGYLICKPRKNCLGFIKDFSSGVLIYEG